MIVSLTDQANDFSSWNAHHWGAEHRNSEHTVYIKVNDHCILYSIVSALMSKPTHSFKMEEVYPYKNKQKNLWDRFQILVWKPVIVPGKPWGFLYKNVWFWYKSAGFPASHTLPYRLYPGKSGETPQKRLTLESWNPMARNSTFFRFSVKHNFQSCPCITTAILDLDCLKEIWHVQLKTHIFHLSNRYVKLHRFFHIFTCFRLTGKSVQMCEFNCDIDYKMQRFQLWSLFFVRIIIKILLSLQKQLGYSS